MLILLSNKHHINKFISLEKICRYRYKYWKWQEWKYIRKDFSLNDGLDKCNYGFYIRQESVFIIYATILIIDKIWQCIVSVSYFMFLLNCINGCYPNEKLVITKGSPTKTRPYIS